MGSDNSEAFATRLQAEDAELLEEAIEETGWARAEIVRQAVHYYLDENPDDIRSLYPDDSLEEFNRELVG